MQELTHCHREDRNTCGRASSERIRIKRWLDCWSLRFYECVCCRGFNKRRLECRDGLWKWVIAVHEGNTLCVCVFGVLFLSGRKDGTVFTGKSARGCLFRAESGGNGVRQKFAVDLKGNATVLSLTSHLFDHLRNLRSVSVGKTGLPQTACDLCDSLDRWW